MDVCIPGSTVIVTKPHHAAIDRLAVLGPGLLMSSPCPCMARNAG